MRNNRREDKHHDVGDSMPGTEGYSEGTLHDTQNTQTFDPSEREVMSEEEVEEFLHSTSSDKSRQKRKQRE